MPYENVPYDGDFTFARIKFEPTEWGPGPYFWGWDLKWNHDYPWAEQNFMKILEELTMIHPTRGAATSTPPTIPSCSTIRSPTCASPGSGIPPRARSKALRDYLLKGGFLVIDDFADLYLRGPQFKNFERQMRRVLPGHELIQLDPSHPVFQTFFKVEDLDFTHPKLPYLDTLFYGVFENNDPDRAADGDRELQQRHRRLLGVVGPARQLVPAGPDQEGLPARRQLHRCTG